MAQRATERYNQFNSAYQGMTHIKSMTHTYNPKGNRTAPPPDVVNGPNQVKNSLKSTKNTNFFNFNKSLGERSCIICAESDHLCKHHRILLEN